MYRFLLTPRWLAAAALTVAAAAVMVQLGNWQHLRYQERSSINARIDAADSAPAVPLTSLLAAPPGAGTPGAPPGERLAWTKVTVSGRYDPTHEIQARGRTVDGDVGFEIVTPLLLADGTAVLIDRGWVPPPPGGALASPVVPSAPAGEVTIVGQIHLSESRPAPIERRDGRLDTRRLSIPHLAREMPYPIYGAYVLLTEQTPAADKAFTPVSIPHEDAWQNAGYWIQWWIFAAMPFIAFGWQARREAQIRAGKIPARESAPSQPTRPLDRVAAADQKRAAAAGRVAPADHPAPVAADRVAPAEEEKGSASDRVAAADQARAAAGERSADADDK